eukprot:m.27854 g.27854  ORF g.27854 m.27854 type:complete len:82 (+) comp30405_c0_seq2:316-561(+)
MTNGGLTMVFKVASGKPGNSQAMWKSDTPLNEDLVSVLSPKLDVRRHYKNSLALAENWRSFGPLEVYVMLCFTKKEANNCA